MRAFKIASQCIVLLLALATTVGGQQNAKPSFTDLSDAVAFIVRCIEDNSPGRFSEAFIESESIPRLRANIFDELVKINKRTPLTALYEGKQFPSNDSSFKLGGHDKELGHIHIFFVKTYGVWHLSETLIRPPDVKGKSIP
jgi:hypothetical protein